MTANTDTIRPHLVKERNLFHQSISDASVATQSKSLTHGVRSALARSLIHVSTAKVTTGEKEAWSIIRRPAFSWGVGWRAV